MKIVHRQGVTKGGQGAEVEIRDQGIMIGTENITSASDPTRELIRLRLIYRLAPVSSKQ